jgi:hypothetical protein
MFILNFEPLYAYVSEGDAPSLFPILPGSYTTRFWYPRYNSITYPRIKQGITILLTLVCLSIYLWWQVWNFEPNNNLSEFLILWWTIGDTTTWSAVSLKFFLCDLFYAWETTKHVIHQACCLTSSVIDMECQAVLALFLQCFCVSWLRSGHLFHSVNGKNSAYTSDQEIKLFSNYHFILVTLF